MHTKPPHKDFSYEHLDVLEEVRRIGREAETDEQRRERILRETVDGIVAGLRQVQMP